MMDSKFVRDPNTNSVVNKDIEAIRVAKEQKQKKRDAIQRQERLEQDVVNLKDDISEIKNLLKQVLNGTNSN